MNPDLYKWIQASLSKHFRTICVANSIKFVSEREIKDVESEGIWVDLRIIGPNFKQLTGSEQLISLEIDLLVSVTPSKSNIYEIDEITGLLTSNCADIAILDDEDTFLFCLTLDSEVPENVKVTPYGQAYDMKIRRASVVAIYESEF
jgi:hypothetical protein